MSEGILDPFWSVSIVFCAQLRERRSRWSSLNRDVSKVTHSLICDVHYDFYVLVIELFIFYWGERKLCTYFLVGKFKVLGVVVTYLYCLLDVLDLPLVDVLAFGTELRRD